MMSKEAKKLALEALKQERENYRLYGDEDGAPEYIHEAIKTLEEALAKQEQGEPVAIHQFRHLHCADWYDGVPDPNDGFGPYEVRTLYTTPQPKQEQGEPVECTVCNDVHAILDADESKIIRNAKDGYPDGRTPRLLTLQERIAALCVYAADWRRWCLEKENTTPQQRKPLTDEEIGAILEGVNAYGTRLYTFARAIEAAHGIKENT
jgi:hypothetical protein